MLKLNDQLSVGGSRILIIAGACAVESLTQMKSIVEFLHNKIDVLRCCVFKPRTSPHTFQGLGVVGLQIVEQIQQTYKVPTITEVMDISQIPIVSQYADILQVGSRNMHNFELLKALGTSKKPIVLKRGFAATIEEFLMAAEYIKSFGNDKVILCERGIRSFDSSTRNVLDLGAVVLLKKITNMPVIVDPSHACGRRDLVTDLAKAAIACGADGLIIECHPEPDLSITDAAQALSLEDMGILLTKVKLVAESVGRHIC